MQGTDRGEAGQTNTNSVLSTGKISSKSVLIYTIISLDLGAFQKMLNVKADL